MTAAIYAARANLCPLVIEGNTPGGQLIWTSEIENFPGHENGIMGPKLMQNMKVQAYKFGTEFAPEMVRSVNFKKKPFEIKTDNNSYLTEAIIIATGARVRMLDLPNENSLIGKGVHTCATCDGAFYKDKNVIVVGGGDSAMEESIFLTRFASKVFIVNRSDNFRATTIMQEKVKQNSKIEIITNSAIKEYIGNEKLEAVKIINLKNNQDTIMKIVALFVAIGHIPNTEIFKNQIKLNKQGYLEPMQNVFTEIEGVFVAGDVADWKYQQAITASGFGCMAAMEAEKYLRS